MSLCPSRRLGPAAEGREVQRGASAVTMPLLQQGHACWKSCACRTVWPAPATASLVALGLCDSKQDEVWSWSMCRQPASSRPASGLPGDRSEIMLGDMSSSRGHPRRGAQPDIALVGGGSWRQQHSAVPELVRLGRGAGLHTGASGTLSWSSAGAMQRTYSALTPALTL